MTTKSLDNLPDDIILDILTHIPTAASISHLSQTSRRAHHLVQQKGWQTWARNWFSTQNLPLNEPQVTSWASVADRLTYHDRCWEKRAFLVCGFEEKPDPKSRQRQRRNRTRGQTVGFYPVLDAKLVASGKDELLVWGAGENLMTRTRPASGVNGSSDSQDEWHTLKGSDAGYSAGFGDVTAVSVVERGATPEVLVGRANGELKLVKAMGESFGTAIQSLLPEELQVKETCISSGTSTPRRSPGQQAISWTEWQPQSNLVASCKNSSLSLFNLDNDEIPELEPVTQYDMTQDSPEDELALIRGAKFMDRETIACALGNSRRPIRWAKIKPTGLEFHDVPGNSESLEWVSSKSETDIDVKTTVRAIEPVGSSGNLLLSAWDDGTYRMMDIRTPSPHDAVYRDRWYTYDAASTLLVYGNQRFVAGSKVASRLHFYDFRYPKSYFHTDAAFPCSEESPWPDAPSGWGRAAEQIGHHKKVHKCDFYTGKQCWQHVQARKDVYRPDAVLHLGDSTHDRVHALAKSSDLASSFYCGFQGSMKEIELKLAEHTQPSDARAAAPAGWQATQLSKQREDEITMMETGTSLCRMDQWHVQETGIPPIWWQSRAQNPRQRGYYTLGTQLSDRNNGKQPSWQYRLDNAYFMPTKKLRKILG